MTATDIPVSVPENIRLEAEAKNPMRRRVPGVPGRHAATSEGWLQRDGALWHYMRGGKSLCHLHNQGAHHLRPFLSGGAKPCEICKSVKEREVPRESRPVAVTRPNPAFAAAVTPPAPTQAEWRVTVKHNRALNPKVDQAVPSENEARALYDTCVKESGSLFRVTLWHGETCMKTRGGSKDMRKTKTPPPAPKAAPKPAPALTERATYDLEQNIRGQGWQLVESGMTRIEASRRRRELAEQHDERCGFRVTENGALVGREVAGLIPFAPAAAAPRPSAPTPDLTAQIADLITAEVERRLSGRLGEIADLRGRLAATEAERDALKSKLAAIQAALGAA